jgi:hypothetical protein
MTPARAGTAIPRITIAQMAIVGLAPASATLSPRRLWAVYEWAPSPYAGPMLSKCFRTLLRQMCFGIQAYWHMCAACLFLQPLFQLFSPFLDKGPDFICHFDTLKSAGGLETIVLSYWKQECQPHHCFLGASLVARHPVVLPDSFLHKVRDFGITKRFRLWGLYE